MAHPSFQLDKKIISNHHEDTEYLAICKDYEAPGETVDNWKQVWVIVKKNSELVFFLNPRLMESFFKRDFGGYDCKKLLSLDKYIDEGLKSAPQSDEYNKFKRTIDIFINSDINPKKTIRGWGQNAHTLFDEFKKRYIHKFIAHTYNEDYIEHFDNLYDFYTAVFKINPLHITNINNYCSPGFKIYKQLKDTEKNYLMFIKFTKNKKLHTIKGPKVHLKHYHNLIPEGDFGWVFTVLLPENYKDKDFEAYVLDSDLKNPSFKKFDRIEGFGNKEEDKFTYKQIFHNNNQYLKNKRLFWLGLGLLSPSPQTASLKEAAEEAYTNLLKGYLDPESPTLNLWQRTYLTEAFIENPAKSIYNNNPDKKNAFIAELRAIIGDDQIVKIQEEKNKTYNSVIFDTTQKQIGFKHNSKNIYIPYNSWNSFIINGKGEEEGKGDICENDKCIELHNYKTEENLPKILESITMVEDGGLNFTKLKEFLINSKFFENNAQQNTAVPRFYQVFLYINPEKYFNNIYLGNHMKLEQKESKLKLTFTVDFVDDDIDYYNFFNAPDKVKVEDLIQELQKVSKDSLKSKIITHYLENYKPSGSSIYKYIDNVVSFFKKVIELENENIKKNLEEQLSVKIQAILKSPQESFEKIGLILKWNNDPPDPKDKIVLYKILTEKYWDNFIEQIDSFYKNELSKQRAEEEKQSNIAQYAANIAGVQSDSMDAFRKTTSAKTMRKVHKENLKTAEAEGEYNIAAKKASEAAENAAKAAEKASEAEAKSKIAAREVEELDTALSEAKRAKIQARIQELEKQKQEAEAKAAKAAAERKAATEVAAKAAAVREAAAAEKEATAAAAAAAAEKEAAAADGAAAEAAAKKKFAAEEKLAAAAAERKEATAAVAAAVAATAEAAEAAKKALPATTNLGLLLALESLGTT